jgi:glycosyltransferase involved in cell wall biosynthesis
MINGKKIIVVMPAYNAEKTLEQTFKEIPKDVVDEVILTDDQSKDQTFDLSQKLGITTYRHSNNRGYGGNQKTCYKRAMEKGADIVVMVHPDYQYTPLLITAIASMIAYDIYDVVLGSRILGNTALKGGMPIYKYIANRALTLIQNLALGQKVSEYHTGYRAFSRKVLESLPLEENSDDFVFDNEMLTQIAFFNFRIGEVSCPTKYFDEASSINFRRSCKYGFGCLANSALFLLARMGIYQPRFLSPNGQRLSGYGEGETST